MADGSDPFGRPTRRSSRLTDEETARRMLETGVSAVHSAGLQLSFDLVSLEALIESADVSRSAVYRRWPTKAHYFADLLLELAGNTHPAAAAYSASTVETACDVAEAFIDMLRSPEGRRQVVVEMCRQGALENYNSIRTGHEWATYVALQATMLSLPPELDLESRIRAALRRSEDNFVERMSAFYLSMVDVVGYNLRSISGVTFETVATMGAAVVEGLAINTTIIPEISETTFEADPFDVGMTSAWSMPALGLTSILLALIEPQQPNINWDDERIEVSRMKLREIRARAVLESN